MPFSTKDIFLPELCKDLSPCLYQRFFRFYLSAYTSICACKKWHKRKSEDILKESVISFYHVGSET